MTQDGLDGREGDVGLGHGAGGMMPQGMVTHLGNPRPTTEAVKTCIPIIKRLTGYRIDKDIRTLLVAVVPHILQGLINFVMHRQDPGRFVAMPFLPGPEADGAVLEVDIVPSEIIDLAPASRGEPDRG